MRRGLALVLLFALAAATACTAGAASTAACGKLLEPPNGLYFGTSPGYANEDQYFEGSASAFDLNAGFHTVWDEIGQWWSRELPFPEDTVKTMWANGRIPFLRLNPYPTQPLSDKFDGTSPGPFTIGDIAAGKYDDALRRWATAARRTNIPLLVEFGTEVNNNFPWSPYLNGGARTDGYGDPTYPDGAERFRDAFRRVVTDARAAGATNISWVWHVDSGFYAGPPSWDTLRLLYPGDDYVDWIGLSLFAYPKPDGAVTTLAEKLQDYHDPAYAGTYAILQSITSRPIFLAETGFLDAPLGSRPAWVADAAAALKTGRFERLKGITWTNIIGGPYDSALTSSGAFLKSFTRSFADPFFRATPRFGGNCSPAAPSVRVKKAILSWPAVPNAATYQVWRDGKRVAIVKTNAYRATKRGSYVVRGVNVVGAGPFSAPRRAPGS